MRRRSIGLFASVLIVASGAFAEDARSSPRVIAPQTAGAEDAAGPAAPGRFVRDANQQIVGAVFDARWLARTIDGDWVLFAAGPRGPSELDDRLFYATPDCTGQAYVADQAGGSFGGFFGFGFWIGDTLYYGVPGEARHILAESIRDHDGDGLSQCFEYLDANLSAPRAPLRTFTLSSPFTPPFHLAQN